MKTVIDAVNEQGSVWVYKDSISAYYRTNGLGGYWYYGEAKDIIEHVCTLEEFNDCIDMLIGDPLKLVIWKESQNINLKPVTVPTFTQEMWEAGTLPSVGMECLFKHQGKMVPGIVVAITERFIILRGNDGNERIRIISEFIVEPLTPPIELIDGERYNFTHEQYGGSMGVYNSADGKFYNWNLWVLASQCKDIQPLTLEVQS